MTRIANWGNYPIVDAEVRSFTDPQTVLDTLDEHGQVTLRGMGRSYGDASLGHYILSTTRHKHLLSFDKASGKITCQAGVTLQDVLDISVPQGWFLPVTPGTKFITIGGAIAADVHGKNHHRDGSFSNHLNEIELLMADGNRLFCSRSHEPELFAATCGGMGMTGVILQATFTLKPIQTATIRTETLEAKDLDAIMDHFDHSADWAYSVAWIDCMARGRDLGRSLLMRGEHAIPEQLETMGQHNEPLVLPPRRTKCIPFPFPSFVMNQTTIRAFNTLYYRLNRRKKHPCLTDYESFFFPLDTIHHWNRIYGRAGFIQYQFVLPLATSREGMALILEHISERGWGSFLAVLKLFGPQEGLLSFPLEGFTLALDFPLREGLLPFLDELDELVLSFGGRVYLAKDARMSRATFLAGYPRTEEFLAIVDRYNPGRPFRSLLTNRVGLT